MRKHIDECILAEADYIIAHGATVRETAKHFSLGKSTVHKDITSRLKSIDLLRYEKAREVLGKNLAERALRGGSATAKKFRNLRRD